MSKATYFISIGLYLACFSGVYNLVIREGATSLAEIDLPKNLPDTVAGLDSSVSEALESKTAVGNAPPNPTADKSPMPDSPGEENKPTASSHIGGEDDLSYLHTPANFPENGTATGKTNATLVQSDVPETDSAAKAQGNPASSKSSITDAPEPSKENLQDRSVNANAKKSDLSGDPGAGEKALNAVVDVNAMADLAKDNTAVSSIAQNIASVSQTSQNANSQNTQQIEQASQLAASGDFSANAAASTGGINAADQADIAQSIGDLSKNVATISSVPKGLEDTIRNATGNTRMVDQTQIFAGRAPISPTATGHASSNSQSKDSNGSVDIAQNMAMLAAASKGLTNMAANLPDMDIAKATGQISASIPVPQVSNEKPEPQKSEALVLPSVPDPQQLSADSGPSASQDKSVTENKAEKEKPEPQDKADSKTTPVPVSSAVKAPEKKQMSAQDSWLLIAAGGIAAILVYRIFGKRNSIDSKLWLKAKYDLVNKLGWEGNFKEVEKQLVRVLDKFPQELEARFILANLLYRKLKQPKRSMVEFEALEKNINRSGVDFKNKDKLKQNIEELRAILRPSATDPAVAEKKI